MKLEYYRKKTMYVCICMNECMHVCMCMYMYACACMCMYVLYICGWMDYNFRCKK